MNPKALRESLEKAGFVFDSIVLARNPPSGGLAHMVGLYEESVAQGKHLDFVIVPECLIDQHPRPPSSDVPGRYAVFYRVKPQ
jgi:hypothetical protein